ncbi:unnamed protein product [Dicrocoelium dendriticum]|nr:unnamed protein product [Dicrocoelium dendriticum]
MYTNTQGLLSKLAELRLRHASAAWDLIAVTEMWLHCEITDVEIALTGVSVVRNDRTSKSGGVALYFRNNMQCERINDSETEVPDAIWCNFRLKGNDVGLLVVVYCPPSSTPEMDCNLMAALSQVIKRKCSHILITGDFNLHALESQATPGEQFKAELQDLVSDYPLYGHVTTPTRFRGTDSQSILDRIFTNEELMVERVITDTPLGRSDHVTLLFHYMCYADYPKEHTEEYRFVTNYDDLSDLIDATCWSFLAELTTEVACREFVNICNKLVASTSETKPYRPKRMKYFVRSRTCKCMALRDLAWRTYTASPNDDSWDVYTTQRNHCVKLVGEDKLKKQQGLVEKFCYNPKLLYRHVNNLRRIKRGSPALHTACGLAQTAQEAANILGQQFGRTFQSV